MTATLSPNGHRPEFAGLSADEANERAEQMARDEPELTGAALARRFGRPERWGRRRIAAVRPAEAVSAPAPGADTVPPAVSAPAPKRTPAPQRRTVTPRARPGQPARPPLALRAVTMAAAATVAVVTARVSYIHIRNLALTHGMGDLAGWLPFGVDGLVVTCSCSLLADRWYSGKESHGSLLGWCGVALGLAGSVAANVLAAPPDGVSRVLAAFSPLALAVSSHQVLRVLGDPAGR